MQLWKAFLVYLCMATPTDGFTNPAVHGSRRHANQSSSLQAESWRQYVPLVVIAGVMLDVALGSPVIKKMYGKTDDPIDNAPPQMTRNERINSDEIAQKAIEKAKATLEMQEYRMQNKDPVKALQDKLEKQQRNLDARKKQ